jgi:hypothetical protein
MKRMVTALMLLGASFALGACLEAVVGATCASSSDCEVGASCVEEVCILPPDAGQVLLVSRPAEGEVVRDQLIIAGTAANAVFGLASAEYLVEGAPWAPLALTDDAFEIALAPSPQPIDFRRFTLLIRGTDRAGRSSSLEIHYAVDQVPPVIQLPAPLESDEAMVSTSSPGIACLRGGCTLTIAPVLADLGTAHVVSAKLDGAAAPIDSDAVTLALAASESGDQRHVLEVTAVDEAGNRAILTRRFRVDVVPPKVEFLSPAADSDCRGDLCAGAVVNLANSSNGKSIVLSGTASDPTASFTLAIGGQAPVSVARGPSGEWSYTWELGSAEGEVNVVAAARDSFGNATAVTRRIWVDLVAPTCAFSSGDGSRRVAPGAALLQCPEAMSLESLRDAVALNGAPPADDAFLDSDNAFHASKSPLPGNTTLTVELKAGATDKAGNPALPLAAVRFRTAPVLPAKDSKPWAGLDYPRLAIDADGLPLLFAWDTLQNHAVLLRWDGKGDGSAGLGSWLSSAPLGQAAGLGPVRDFQLTQFAPSNMPLNADLSLRREARVLMSPADADGTGSSAVTAGYAQSEDDLATFHGVSGNNSDPDSLPGLSPGAHPSFFSDPFASMNSSGAWVFSDSAVQVLFANHSAQKVQVLPPIPGWHPNEAAMTPIAAAVTAMHQGGFVGKVPGAAEPHAFLAVSGDSADSGAAVPASQSPALAVAGLRPLFHSGYAIGLLAWSEYPSSGNAMVVLRLGCRDFQSGGPWVFSGPLEPRTAGATRIASIDFGQGVSKVAIAVDFAAEASTEDRVSQFGLISGDACGVSPSVDWLALGSAVEGRNPTTAFSDEEVLWRALVGSEGLRVLAPFKP